MTLSYTFKWRWHLLLLLCITLALTNLKADDDKITTLDVTQDTVSAISSCLHYKVTGVCFWLQCDGPICSVNQTLKVDHYLPDAEVSVYRKDTSNPWDYANTVIDSAAQRIGQTQTQSLLNFKMGYGSENAGSIQSQDSHFKEVDIIGNPAISLFTQYAELLLPSQATPFLPYYLSMADAYMWRSPLTETVLYPSSIVPGVHMVGSLINNWGSIYPRTGFLNQPADAKAAAVLAQRAADIATKDYQPHVYTKLNSDSCGDHCQVAAATENSTETQWQMIYPNNEHQCIAFGENDLMQLHPWNSEAAQKGHGNYAWILWRHYHGCIPGQGQYIGSTDL